MDFIFDNFYIIAIAVITVVSWLKKRSEAKYNEEEERRVREEMIRGLEEMSQHSSPPRAAQQPATPKGRQAPPMPKAHGQRPPAPPLPQSHVTNPAHAVVQPQENFELIQQRDIQERFAEAKRVNQLAKDQANQAKRTRTTKDGDFGNKAPSPNTAQKGLRGILNDRKGIRRAMVLREVLGPPVSLQ
jgi:hypothetical protein